MCVRLIFTGARSRKCGTASLSKPNPRPSFLAPPSSPVEATCRSRSWSAAVSKTSRSMLACTGAPSSNGMPHTLLRLVLRTQSRPETADRARRIDLFHDLPHPDPLPKEREQPLSIFWLLDDAPAISAARHFENAANDSPSPVRLRLWLRRDRVEAQRRRRRD